MKTNRLYNELAWIWPLWGDAHEYATFCEGMVGLIYRYARRDVKTLLNLGCGGGKNVFNLKERFAVTGLDLSKAMLENAHALNPECHFIIADIRDFSLSQKFDAILVDDGIAYMTSEAELAAVFDCAYAHLSPGGVMLVGPDDTTETFVQNKSVVTQANKDTKHNDTDVVIVENRYDPDPKDSVIDALMIFIIRENGKLRIEYDMHTLGLFPPATWKRLLRKSGFETHEAEYDENGRVSIVFACVKPIE